MFDIARVSSLSPTRLINSMKHEHSCKIYLYISIYLSISTASPPLGDYVQVSVSAVLVAEMLLKIKSSHKIC